MKRLRVLLTDAELAALASVTVEVRVRPFNWTWLCWQPMRPQPVPQEICAQAKEAADKGIGLYVGWWGLNVAIGPIGITVMMSPPAAMRAIPAPKESIP